MKKLRKKLVKSTMEICGIDLKPDCGYCKLHMERAHAFFTKTGIVTIKIKKDKDGSNHLYCHDF